MVAAIQITEQARGEVRLLSLSPKELLGGRPKGRAVAPTPAGGALGPRPPPGSALSLLLRPMGLQLLQSAQQLLDAHQSSLLLPEPPQGLGRSQSRSFRRLRGLDLKELLGGLGAGSQSPGTDGPESPTVGPCGLRSSPARAGAGAARAGREPAQSPGRDGSSRRSGRDLTGRGQRGGRAGSRAPRAPRRSRASRAHPWPPWSGTKVRARGPRGAHPSLPSGPALRGGGGLGLVPRASGEQSRLPSPGDLGRRGGDSGAAGRARGGGL